MRILIACLFSLVAMDAAVAKSNCVVIPDHAATNDEGGWVLDRPRGKSVWISNRDVRRYGGKIMLLCGKKLLMPK